MGFLLLKLNGFRTSIILKFQKIFYEKALLATLNLRGERSVTCKGDFDKHPSEGPLPPGAPPVCEMFRQMPDALGVRLECAQKVTWLEMMFVS
jgi:hypothetical protein